MRNSTLSKMIMLGPSLEMVKGNFLDFLILKAIMTLWLQKLMGER